MSPVQEYDKRDGEASEEDGAGEGFSARVVTLMRPYIPVEQ